MTFNRTRTRRSHSAALVTATLMSAYGSAAVRAVDDPIPGGELQIFDPAGNAAGACPLKYTDVQAEVVGFFGRTTVKQTFHNPLDRKIEAVYVFPLPQDAAVDDMTMTIGDRRIVGQIKPRDEARQVYEAARAAGHVASLLDQERPNVFTQSVANIEPGAEVVIEISYVETLKYEDGVFEWVFPMVVGPRYIPGGGSAPAPMTGGTPTPQVPDADKITPPVAPPGTRAGHDISLAVNIDAGMPLFDVVSALHDIEVATNGPNRALVTLKHVTEIPNRDFILRYRLTSDEIGDAFLVHGDPRGRFFALILQPPRRVVPDRLVPRELVFVLDTSGSMQGFPITEAKEVMAKAIDAMQPFDTFNLITFAGDTRILWEVPRPNTPQNRAETQAFLASHEGSGGTEMMKAINAALTRQTTDDGRIRVVCFMTDGYVGNDMAIIDAVKKNTGTTRVFSFGIGQSVNRFLLDGMARAGRGEVEFVTLESQADAAAERFHERILAPVLTDITIDWGRLPVADVYPPVIPDLFSAKPVVIFGRLTAPKPHVPPAAEPVAEDFDNAPDMSPPVDELVPAGEEGDEPLSPRGGEGRVRGSSDALSDEEPTAAPAIADAEQEPAPATPIFGMVTIRGRTGAGPFERAVKVTIPPDAADGDALATLWARSRVADLMMQEMGAMQTDTPSEVVKSQITALGLEFRLMTQYTSFVAVEELYVTMDGEPTRIDVPVEMPDGVSYEGVFGEAEAGYLAYQPAALQAGEPRQRQQQAQQLFSGGSADEDRAGGQHLVSPPSRTTAERLEELADLVRKDAEGKRQADAEEADPLVKLALPLLGLAEKVKTEGKDGNLTVGKLKVADYRVPIMVYLADLSDETLKALKDLGFTTSAEAKSVRLLIGAIDVRKLEDLAKLEAVIRVTPVS